jgi:DNA-binding beta-propeller fold protein YncE
VRTLSVRCRRTSVVAAATVGLVLGSLVPAGGASGDASRSRLIAVSDTTGAVFEIPLSGSPTATNLDVAGVGRGDGLAYDTRTDTLYAINFASGHLFKVPLSGGAATDLGDTGIGSDDACGLEFDPEGDQLWAIGYTTSRLFTIPLSGSPTASVVGPTGIPTEGPCGLALDPDSERLYTADYANDVLYRVSTTTGLATPVNSDFGVDGMCGLAFDTDGDRVLGVDQAGGVAPAVGPSHLWQIPVTNGAAVDLGNTGVNDLCGLAFIPAEQHAEVRVTKAVVGTPPPGATYQVEVDCDGEQDDKVLTFGETGGTQTFERESSEPLECEVTETVTGGAGTVEITCANAENAECKQGGKFELFDDSGDDTRIDITVTNTFAVVAEPTFTG